MIKILRGPSPTQKAVSDAATAGMSTVLSAFSSAVDLVPHNKEELLYFLQFRSAIAQRAKGRSRFLFGKMYNRLSGEDPDYVELSGIHLKQTLMAAGRNIPEIIVADGEYKLRLDVATAAIANLANSNEETPN